MAFAWDIMVLSSRSMTVFLKVENVVVVFVERPSTLSWAVIKTKITFYGGISVRQWLVIINVQVFLRRKTDLVKDAIELGTTYDFFMVLTVWSIK